MEGSGQPVSESLTFARIVAFTDGVFAIAITVLVLSLDVPGGLPGSDLHEFLVDAWPQLFAYFLSFAVIGRFWIGHHHMFAMLHDFDRGLLALNLAYLSLISLVPFPTELLGEYGSRVESVVVYGAVVGSVALMGWVMLRYALDRGHVRPDARQRAAAMAPRMLWPALVFYVSVPIAFLSPQVAQLSWLVLLLGGLRPRRAAPAAEV